MRWKALTRAAALALLLAAAANPAILAQTDGPGPAPDDATAPPPAAPEPGTPAPAGRAPHVRFNFKGATIDQVIDFFSRATGLPVVRETDVPQGTVDFLSPEEYDLPEALRTLNIILQSRGVMLRAEDNMLYLQKLTDMQRENIPVYVGELEVSVTDEQIVTVVRPLAIALAKPLAENLSKMVAEYGAVAALNEQNAIVITETAGQVRRLLRIVEELDRDDPEGAVRLFGIRHARAADLMVPLNALLSEKIEKYVINQQGQQVKIEESQLPGLAISHDDRTNSIIAKGVQSRIEKLGEAIELLDVPASNAGRSLRTIALHRLAPQDAAARLTALYARLPEDRRPTVIALDDVGKVTIVGAETSIVEGMELLRELEGDEAITGEGGGRIMTVAALEHASPAGIITALQSLLNGRQLNSTRLVAGPDGRSIIIAGPVGDVEAVRSVLSVLDRPREIDRQVRLMRLTSAEPRGVLERALRLYGQQLKPDETATMGLSSELDEASRLLTLIGASEAIERFTAVLRMVETNAVVDRETRQIELTSAVPSRVAASLQALSGRLLQSRDGRPYVEPLVEPVDELDLLVVTAEPAQFAVIDSLIETLDRPDPADFQFRVIGLSGVEGVERLLERAMTAYAQLARGGDPERLPAPQVEVDALSGNLIVSGASDSVRLFEQALSEARRLLPPARSGRLLALNQAKASDVIGPLRDLLERTAPVDPARTVPAPSIEVIEHTNSLYVLGEPAQHQIVEQLVHGLDTFELTDLPPLRLLQVRAADAAQIASLLGQRYGQRPAEQRRQRPVQVSADSGTNTLIVVAHQDLFEEIRTFVDEVNRSGDSRAERETMIFPLRRARAQDLAQALERLYPQPPVPLDARGRPLPHLQKPKEVHVSADTATNTLIVEAPVERRASFEALVEQLDRIELPPAAELRTYHIERGDPEQIARTLSELARQGVLSDVPDDGSQPVPVTIQAESLSRTLIVAGDAVTFEKIAEVLADLQAVPVPRSLRVFEVTGADPEQLAQRALRLYDEQTAEIPGARPVSVEVDRENSTLLVVADDEAMVRFAGILNGLRDAIGPPPDVRLIPLQYATAVEVVEFLRGLTGSEMATLARFGPVPIFEAVERTNSILVAARPDQLSIVEAIVRSLDIIEQEMPPLRILQLRTADAENLAAALSREYGRRPIEERTTKPVNISADAQTNSLIVAAHPDMLPQIHAIVSELNTTSRLDSEGREIRIFPLEVARAEELARTIDEMFPEPPVPVDARGRPMPHLKQPREVVVRADAQTNSLIVDAPVQRMTGFETLVEQLDRQKIAEDTEIRTYRLVHAEPEQLAAALRQLSQAGTLSPSGSDRRVPITVSTEPMSRALIVSGPADAFERVERVLEEIDAPRRAPPTVLRFFKLEHARAEAVSRMLREVLLTRMGDEVPEAGSNVEALLNVTSDRKTNTLIISAPAALMPLAQELVAQLDSGGTSLGEPLVRVRPLTFADASDVSSALTAAIAALVSPATGEAMAVRLFASPGSNALIMVGLEEELAEVEKLVEPLDARPALDAIDARTFTLVHADAAAVAPVVQRLLADQQMTDPRLVLERIRRSRGQVDLTPPVRVEADQRTNSLIVSGPQRTVALAQTLIEQLDAPLDDAGGGRGTFEVFTPANSDPRVLASTVQEVLVSAQPFGRRATLRLLPEPHSGAIVLVGREDERGAARDLLERWDREARTAPQMDLKVLRLEHSAAPVVAQAVAPLLQDRGRWPQSLLAALRAGLTIGQPTITADEAGNRLLISAPADLMPLALELAGELDQPQEPGAAVDVRVFNLRTAEVDQVATAVNGAMAARRAAHPGEPLPTVTAEPSSNSLVVTAGPQQMAEIEALLGKLDEGAPSDQPQVRAVFLHHARAETVAPIIEQLLAAEEVPIWIRYDALARGRQLPDSGAAVRVAADARLNAVVIAAPVSVLEVAEQMVAQLDVDPGAVAGSAVRSVRVLAIENADATELSANLEALFADPELSASPPVIRVDTSSNSLIVRATDAQFTTIEEVVGRIDRATIATSRQVRLIPIDPSRASAAEVARTLERLLDRGGAPRVEIIPVEDLLKKERSREPRPDGPQSLRRILEGLVFAAVTQEAAPEVPALTIAVDPATNSLIVIGSPRSVERVAALAGQIQQEIPAAPGTVRFIGLSDVVEARAIAQLVNQTLGRMTPPGGAAGGYGERVAILADDPSNALVVVANDSDFELVGDLIAALSRPAATDEILVKVYPLRMINAERALASVQALLEPAGPGRARPRDRQAQRMRQLAVTFLSGDERIEAVFDPQRLRVSSDAQSNALVVMGPPEAIAFIDRYIELIDQTPLNVQTTLKVYPLRFARASDLENTLRRIFQMRFESLSGQPGLIQPEIAADNRTNTLLVTAAPEMLAEVDGLLRQLDQKLGEDLHPLRVIELKAAQPSTAARLLDRIVIGTDQGRRSTTSIVPDDNSGTLLVRASPQVSAEIDAVIGEIDRDATRQFEVRTITLEHAQAASMAEALQRFFDDRSRIATQGRGRREQSRRVSIVGDPTSNTLLIAASEDDFEQIRTLVEQFDTPQGAGALTFRVFPLKHAKARDLQATVQQLVDDLTYNQGPAIWFWPPQDSGDQERNRVAVRADERLNALIVTGSGDKFSLVQSLIEMLDTPRPEGEQRIVKLYRVAQADIAIVEGVVRELFEETRQRRWWEPPDPSGVRVRMDERTNTLIVSASTKQHEEIGTLIAGIDGQAERPQQETVVLAVQYARAADLADTLQQFLRERARATNSPVPGATVLASDSANSLVVSAAPEELATIRDLLSRLDQPDVTGDRVIEIIVLEKGKAEEIARIVKEQFARRGGDGVVVTPDARTNSIIVNAPREQFTQAKALVARLDSPPASDETIIRTYALKGARATEVVDLLTQTLRLDEEGRTTGVSIKREGTDEPPVDVKATIVADRRSNSLVVTATEESFPVIEGLIEKVDQVAAVAPRQWKIIPLQHARAFDVYYTLRDFLRTRGAAAAGDDVEARVDYNEQENQLIVAATPDQFEQIEQIIGQIDVPSPRRRITEFVPLQFADAEQVRSALSYFYGDLAPGAETPAAANVRITADPVANSLVISAEVSEWESIRGLLAELDREEYDASLQLRVIALEYADARSVAQAINDAFAGTLERGGRGGGDGGAGAGGNGPERERGGGGNGGGERRDVAVPSVLVESEEWVRAAAEAQTNSIIVTASRKNMGKIEAIIAELDVADYARLPPPKIIPVTSGDPDSLAQSLRQLYAQGEGDRRGTTGTGRKALRIVGSNEANAIIVRAEEEDFLQIRSLAEALQQEMATQGLAVHVIKLGAVPARRIAEAVTATFQVKADQMRQPFAIEVDVPGNSLIVASTGPLFEEIRRTVSELDALAPAAGQGIFIIELENIAPEEARRIIETIGLDQPLPDDSLSRLVSEPVKVSVLTGRRAVVVVANPADRETIVGLLKAIDAAPQLAEARVRVVKLRNARAEAVVAILSEVLDPSSQQSRTALAEAVSEQVRRLSVRRDGLEEPDIQLDLSRPIRLVPDASLNAVIVSSTAPNVEAIEGLIGLFDALPITDAVTVQIFPLENISAEDFARIVRDLFDQGKDLGQVVGSEVSGVPASTLGRALLDEIALATDERTNTVIVAGKEEAVAFVEVMSKRIDSEVTTGWVEPRLVRLQHADAENLAELLQEALVDDGRGGGGAQRGVGTSPLQRQVARLRMARADQNGGKVIESEVFQPMTRLFIRAEPQLNAIVLVGTPMNLEIVRELIHMLDIEAASPSAVVRVYPVEHASAMLLARTVTQLFDQQVESKAIRPEDRVIVQADNRTNSLVVTTSPRSFTVLEHLLQALDAEVAPDLREIRTIVLTNASATRLAQMIQQLMDARLERLREVQPETADLEKASIIADTRSNSLIVAAGNESFEVIKRLAGDLDRSNLIDMSLVEVINLESSNIERLAAAIDRIMERRYAEVPAEVRASQRPLILTDPRSNSLLVAASPEDMIAIRDLVTKLEAAPINPAVGVEVIVLEAGRAEAIAPRLQRLMRERQQTLGAADTPADRVVIDADTASNSLIIAASEENLAIVRGLIGALSQAGAGAVGDDEFAVIQLSRSRASDLIDLLEDLYVQEENRVRGDNTVRVTADEQLNAILVNAPEKDIAALRRLVAQLDGARPATVMEVKYIPLTSANALETVSLIENVLSGRGIGARRSVQQSTVLKYLRQIAGDDDGEVQERPGMSEMEVTAAIRESIVLTPDVRTNTIIVSAPAESMEMIEGMILDLDSSSVGAQSIRIFKLTNADANAMAGILEELFSLTRQGNLYVLKPRELSIPNAVPVGVPAPGAAPGPPGLDQGMLPYGFSGTELTAVPDERQQLSITVDSRTNSLLVSGTPTYLDLVAEVVEELDAMEANERSVFVYQLRNATATEVARVVQNFIDTEQEKLVSTLGSEQLGSAARLLEREVTIVDDTKSNSVLVSVSPRYEQRIRQIIEELDIDPPQVLIQVLLAEVTLDSEIQWGVDLGYEFGAGDFTVSGGYGLASAFVSGMGVPQVSVSSSDFSLLIRALQAQGRLQVLSNPSIMAANNETARLQVGETIRVPDSTSFSAASQQSTVVPEDIGIILEVTPSINPDGFVRMEVQPEISELSERTTQISEDFESPIITRRSANTTITVRDGQTIVIGGLISDRYERRENMVPVLGELPLIGPFFRADKEKTMKTELLIVLTPYVIESPTEIDMLTEAQIDRLTLPEGIKDEIRRSMLEGRLYDAEGRPIYDTEGQAVRPSKRERLQKEAEKARATEEAGEADQPEREPK